MFYLLNHGKWQCNFGNILGGRIYSTGNDERHYNSVSAWQYTDPPYNNAKSKFEGAMDYLRNDFENIKKYTEGELEFSLLGGTSGDEIFVVMPRCTADLDCINTIHRYLNGYTKVSNNDIGKILVLKLAPPDENIKQYAPLGSILFIRYNM